MYKTYFLIYIFIVTIFTVQGQQSYYQLYEGPIHADTLVMLFHAIDQQVWGVMYTKEPIAASTNLKYIEFEGDITEQGQLNLKMAGKDDIVFTGTFKKGEINGSFVTENQNIRLKSNNDNHAVKFKIINQSASSELFPGKEGTPVALIELIFIFPERNTRPMLWDSFKTFNSSSDEKNNFDEKELILKNMNSFFDQYAETRNITNDGGFSFQWNKSVRGSIVFTNNDLVCLKNSYYVFTGGAHGMQNHAYGIFLSENGFQLLPDLLFTENYRKELSVILTNTLKQSIGLPEEKSLSSEGYFVDLVEPNDNIYLTPSGIGFYYNSYEIAPYSTGHTNIFISFDKIYHLINTEYKTFFDPNIQF
ncbi:MAG: hypothetical protein CVT92_07250 [Bacteroidetes bacterium HGW-Bacteroidetes-1]|jgi:hypothetical protein|nr:MAG: hypothetical protein CVT92_07250 [Bacteroidetes bacterium HGW-Bacteroidetes-1]